MTDTAAFRCDVRAWLEANCPPAMRQRAGPDEAPVTGGRRRRPDGDAALWLERMADRGWTAPMWPRRYGGAGLDPVETKALAAELRAFGAPPPLVSPHGLHMIGPALLRFGRDDQKADHLPAIAAGEIRWCQGFSEPEAGSDLAGLRCRALRAGDDYVVSGQKLWTSFADESDWIFCLVRTDPASSGRQGLSLLLFDLETRGVRVRPVPLLSGRLDFCEVFLDEVRVPVGQRLGAESDGWAVARFILEQERNMLGDGDSTALGSGCRVSLVDLAREALGCPDRPLADPELRDAITQAEFDRLCCRAAVQRSVARARGGRHDEVLHPSVLKHSLATSQQRRADLRSRIAGLAGAGWSGEAFTAAGLSLGRDYLDSKARTIGGGTTEIMLNTIARRVLGLPHLGPERAS